VVYEIGARGARGASGVGSVRRTRSSTARARRDVSRDDAFRGVLRARARRVRVDARGVGATRARVCVELDRTRGAPRARAARDDDVVVRV